MPLLARRWLEHFNADMGINPDARAHRNNPFLFKRDITMRRGNLQRFPAVRVLHVFHPRRIFNLCVKYRLVNTVAENINVNIKSIMEERNIQLQSILFNIERKIGLIFVLFASDPEELDKLVFIPPQHTLKEAG